MARPYIAWCCLECCSIAVRENGSRAEGGLRTNKKGINALSSETVGDEKADGAAADYEDVCLDSVGHDVESGEVVWYMPLSMRC